MREMLRSRLPAPNPKESPGSWLGAGGTSRAASAPRAPTDPKGLSVRGLGEGAIVQLLPQIPRRALCPGSGESTAQGGNNIDARAMDRSRDPRAPALSPGEVRVLEGLGRSLRPIEAGASPAPPERSGHRPRGQAWALCPGLARGGCRTRVGHRGLLPEKRDRRGAARLGALSCRHRVCGREVPTVAKKERSVCSKLSTVPNSKLSASIKRSGGGGAGEAFWGFACK